MGLRMQKERGYVIRGIDKDDTVSITINGEEHKIKYTPTRQMTSIDAKHKIMRFLDPEALDSLESRSKLTINVKMWKRLHDIEHKGYWRLREENLHLTAALEAANAKNYLEAAVAKVLDKVSFWFWGF